MRLHISPAMLTRTEMMTMREEHKNYLKYVESASDMQVVLDMEKYKMKHLAGRFFPQKKCKVLEVGIGKGHHAMFLQQMGHDVQGIDIGDYHKARLEAQGIPLSILDAGKDPFPFKDESFDVIFTSHLLEHLRALPFHEGM